MTSVNLPNRPIGTDARSIAAILANFDAVLAAVNGGIDGDNLAPSVARAVGVSDSSVVRRGSALIAASESITNSSFATLATPDQVANIVVPTNGILLVSYWARVEKTAGASGDGCSVGVYLGNNPVRDIDGHSSAQMSTGTVCSGSSANVAKVFTGTNPSVGYGALLNFQNSAVVDDTTNGHVIGMFVPIIVAPGTYTVNVKYQKIGSPTMAAANRRLYVEAKSY